MSEQPSLRNDVLHAGRGFLMGGADIIPGVSGGTMALLLGVYERLVTALSHFDLTLLDCVRRRDWAAAAAHIDLRFLAALGLGIAIGVVGLAGLMHYLLDQHSVATWSFLFGLILASAFLVMGMVARWSATSAAALVAGAVFAWWLVGALPVVPPDGLWYVFVCGAVAICAMILPGISGAFILVIMGMYFHVTGVLRSLAHGEVTIDNLLLVAIFAAGCTIGLLTFSKFLRLLLTRYEPQTMAAMAGILFGSLRKIWPFKHEVATGDIVAMGFKPEDLERLHKYRLGENYWPANMTSEIMLSIGLAIAGLVVVLVLDRLVRITSQVPPLEPEGDS
jgi:putative membrane protein